MNAHIALCDLLKRKQRDISALEEDALMSKRALKKALAKNPNLPEDDEARFFCRMCNSGEKRLLQRTWKEQCDLVWDILGAFADEGFETS
jgi:hypothetical protein